jgi:hypothetical protein
MVPGPWSLLDYLDPDLQASAISRRDGYGAGQKAYSLPLAVKIIPSLKLILN